MSNIKENILFILTMIIISFFENYLTDYFEKTQSFLSFYYFIVFLLSFFSIFLFIIDLIYRCVIKFIKNGIDQ